MGPDVARFRFFFLLNRHIDDEALYAWAKSFALASGLKIDPRVMVTNQPIYTARPQFPADFSDPVPSADRVILLDGDEGDQVPLDLDEFVSKAARVEAASLSQRAAARRPADAGAGSWVDVARASIGLGGHCREAITSAMGLAIREGAEDDEIVATLVEITDDVDPHRIESYGGERELLRWLADFRRREQSKQSNADRARLVFRNFLNRKKVS